MSKNYTGVIIEQSLKKKLILQKLKIIKTKIVKVTKKHQTPWIKQWTMHTVEILNNDAEKIAREVSESLDSEHDWYADFENNKFHYIIFYKKVFKVDILNKKQYVKVIKYGISLGIPDYQLEF
ncbi:hypothetical protein KKA15_06005 [Patescibacteria group bacterium]|nr:hypothetical protein [Patescibacteria group bacterium]